MIIYGVEAKKEETVPESAPIILGLGERSQKKVSGCLLVAVCWAGALSDVLVAAAVMLLVGRRMATTGALVGAHGAPLRKLALGLGAGCGLAGCFVIHRLHGDSRRYALIHVRHSPDSLDKCMILTWGALSMQHSAELLESQTS